ncbi:MAG: hypothetical protein IH946_10745, partial [Bacteroidetes bacterium]|nr:hypothetical protein [Bacteroidota bacterium]
MKDFNKRMRLLPFAITALTLVISSGCFQKDFEKLKTPRWTPDVAIPLAKSEITVDELLNRVEGDSLFVDLGSGGFVTLIYSGTVFSNKGENIVELPKQVIQPNINLPSLQFDDFDVTDQITFGQLAANLGSPASDSILANHGNTSLIPVVPAQSGGTFPVQQSGSFSSLTFSGGELVLTVTNNFPIDITNLQAELIDNISTNVIASFTIPVIPAKPAAPNNVGSDNSDMTGVTITNDLSISITSLSSPGSPFVPVPIDTTDELIFNLTSNGLEASGGTAIIPTQTTPTFSDTVLFQTTQGERIQKLNIKEGGITFTPAGTTLDPNIILTLELPDAKDGNGDAFREDLNLGAPQSFDLAGYEFDLGNSGVSNGIIFNMYISSNGQEVQFSSSDKIEPVIVIKDMVLEYIEGYLGQQQFSIDADTINIAIFKNLVTGSVTFANPKIEIIVRNGFGIPIQLDFKTFDAIPHPTLGMGPIPLTFTTNPPEIPVTFNHPSLEQVGELASTTITLDNSTSNLVYFIELSPIAVIYEIDVTANPGMDTTDLTNFITDSSYFEVDINVELPLDLRINNLTIQDTFDINPDQLS